MIEVKGRASLDGKAWQAGLQKIEKQTGDSMSQLKNTIIGAFTAGAIIAASKKVLDYAGHINDLSQRLGVSTDKLQEFDFAAQQNGATLDTFTGFLEKLASARAKALEGNEDAIASFTDLGVSIDDLKTKRLDQLTNQIANKVKDSDVQKIIAPLKEIGGKGAGDLVAAFKSGLDEAGQDARDSGTIIKEETIRQLDEIGDRFSTLGMQLQAGLAPILAGFSDGIQAIIDELKVGAAWIGGATAMFDIKKLIMSWITGGIVGFTKEASKELGAGSLEADKAAQTVRKDIVKREDNIIKNRQNSAIGKQETPEGDGTKKDKTKFKAEKPVGTVGDSLTKVGNFLGASGQPMIETIARQQVEISKTIATNTMLTVQQLALMTSMVKARQWIRENGLDENVS